MSRKKIIVLIGPPCSGKSTIGRLVADRLGIEYISSGDIARNMARHDISIDIDLNNGKLAPEDKMRNAISNKLWQHLMVDDRDVVILDGFPRFGEQAEWLRNTVSSAIEIQYVLIYTRLSTIIERSSARGRSDDKSLQQRLEYYYGTTFKDMQSYINYIIDTDEYTIDECTKLLTIICERGEQGGFEDCKI